MKSKKKLIILTGPTAVGKTALSVQLAKSLNTEIISADSMQVYKGMDIGSAKITKEEMAGIRHHLIDIVTPFEEFNVVEFQKCAKLAMEEIYAKDKIPIIVGGTGFYIQALLYDVDFKESVVDEEFRKQMYDYAGKYGAEALHNKLNLVDEKAADEIPFNNVKRVIRALEFNRQTGRKISEHNEQERVKESPYDFVYFVLNDDRAALYERIEKRIDTMLENGLLEEVMKLRELGCNKDMVSMKGIGYKEILDYFDGNTTYSEAIDILKRDTRHFAKRQLTWFRREKKVEFINIKEFDYNKDILLQYTLQRCIDVELIEADKYKD
jgi:tRNA dimethylallyltransferase